MQAVNCRPSPVFSALRPTRVPRAGSVRGVVAVNAQLPKSVTAPTRLPIQPPATFGFVDNAERINARAAMIGFFAILIVEAIMGKGLFEKVGMNVGNGLPFEF